MKFDLAAMTRRVRNPRRSRIPLRPIRAPAILAGDLYAAAYRDIILTWQAGAVRLQAAYAPRIPARDAMLADAAADDMTHLIDDIGNSIQRLLLTLTPRLRSWALNVERWQRTRWTANVLSASGVDLKTLIGPNDVAVPLDTSIARNVALVRNVSEEIRGKISESVFRGFSQRSPARDVAKEIDQAVSLGRKRSLRIASDQMTKLASALNSERRRQAGMNAWIWLHSEKKHPRPVHVARNGHEYTDETAPADLPGTLPFCGCLEQAVLHLE